MSGAFRARCGGSRVERGRPVRFRFDGRAYIGLGGDTLASALLANGVHLIARSFKHHRPRGILCAGAEEPGALVTVRRDAARCTPNLRATQVELYEGLTAYSQNRWPSLRWDVGALAAAIAPLIPRTFHYKTLKEPGPGWKWLYEPWLRAASGLGQVSRQADPDRYTQRHAHCELLVVGAGPAGLAAAVAAAASGARVILCDEQSELGGSLLTARDEVIRGEPVASWRARQLAQLAVCPRVTLLPRTSAFGCLPHNSVGLVERLTDHLAHPHPDSPRERLWQVRAKEVVLATGALERPLVFPGNDRPGILLAGAARTYLNRYGVLCGRRAVLVTACDEGYRAALDLMDAGVRIVLIADVRPAAEGSLVERARSAGIRVETRMRVLGTRGRLRVHSLQLARLNPAGQVGRVLTLACDLVLMSGGYTPSVHLFSQSHGELRWDDSLGTYVPGQTLERLRTAGGCRGLSGLEQVIQDGMHAGAAAAHDAGCSPPGWREAGVVALEPGRGAALTASPPRVFAPQATQPAFVDWQNDVTPADRVPQAHGGLPPLEGPGESVPPGLGAWRLPYTPVSFGSFAGLSRGELFAPVRRTAITDWAVRHGAVFEDERLWRRPRAFPQPGEEFEAAVMRECLAVRRSCGLLDASPQGRIEVVGPDALDFLERLYINSLSDLAVGGCRYALLLREDGSIQDDGIIARVAPDRFHVTTTVGGDANVLALMEDYRQSVWRELRVWVTSTTDAWAVIAVQGPLSRQILQAVIEDLDLSGAALPHMSVAPGKIRGVSVLVLRVSFTGELGFEVRVPADYGEAVWEAILEAGEAHGGVTPYGTAAMSVLRAEKGYVLLGQDTDSSTIPEDVGLGWPIGNGKPDFVGKRSLEQPAMSAPDRLQLVGLLPLDPRIRLEEGAQVLRSRRGRRQRALGHVTSSCHSPTLGRSISLAVVSGGRGRMGQILHVPGIRGGTAVQVTSPTFYDPEGNRLHV